MAGNDPTQVIVAPGGVVAVAPEGTAEPANEDSALNAAFVDVGYISEDGVRFNTSPNVTDIAAWQSTYPIRSETETREGGIAFTMRQWNLENFKIAFGGGFAVTITAGHWKYRPPSGAQSVNAVIVTWTDTHTYRIVVPRAQIVEAVEFPLRRAAAADLPVTFRVLGPTAGGDPWYLLTDDPDFAS
jgi:hypothetical protein